MVWLQDKRDNRFCLKIDEALAWWIPEALRSEHPASLALCARRLQSRLPILGKELESKNKMVGDAMIDANHMHWHIAAVEDLLEDAFGTMSGFLDRYKNTRRLRFQKEAPPLFDQLTKDLEKLREIDGGISAKVTAHFRGDPA